MNFMKVIMKQAVEGAPGFVEEEEFEVQINLDKITLFNKSEEDKNVTFVRLECGATICIAMPYVQFIKKMQEVIKNGTKLEK